MTPGDIRTYFKKHLIEVISFIVERLQDRDENTLYPRDQPDRRRATHRIVSTAGAAARLPHSTRYVTRMTGE